ncbi:glucokinase [Thermoleptolyngbya oregonensis NK1-22]|uniref:Glucokinase n=1 Tax=Thermoleptolyngbya oregonensis NK1-22 TaxID=2547457 RepID=A0AA97B9D8_9CYAN|nr:glucokinase [Thermoleptolyngbya oregonensis]WOB42370.1 glucokinase [Thermoleptolyngbya oregonensis NK1-22]
MTRLLAGDIGGTKTILRLAEVHSDDGPIKLQTLHEMRYVSAEYLDLVPMVRAFLADAEDCMGCAPGIEKACFAIAGPVVNNTSVLTNLSWTLEGDRLSRELNIPNISLINDFEAVGYGILGLGEDDYYTLQAGKPQSNAPIAVIGAGTGLGQGFLIPQGGVYYVYPSEGGHADFAPRSELEFQLLKYLLDKLSINRLSAERIVSGQGIVSIYQFLRDRQLAEESPDIGAKILTWEREAGKAEKSVDPGAVISLGAQAGDRLCQQTMTLFASSYGAEAGNLALKLLPFGGLYIAGGIAAKNLDVLKAGGFMEAFLDKGRMSPLLEQVPVHVVLNPQVGLIGAAVRAARL